MDLELSSEQKDIKAAAREFAEGEFSDTARDFDAAEEYPVDLWKKACELGFVGLFIDEEHGGAGLGLLEQLIVLEEFCRIDPGCGHVLLSTMGAEIIMANGTEEQKRRYVAPLAKGTAIMGCALAENGMGIDASTINTTAVRSGDVYIINGKKAFVPNGSVANYLIVLCLTDPSAESPDKKFSLYIVDTKLPGCDTVKVMGKIGLRASDVATVTLRNVKVSAECLVGGKEGKGLAQIQSLLDARKLFAAAQSIGAAQGAMEQAMSYVKQRKAFGKTISAFESTQLKIGEMATYIEASRRLCYQAAWMLDHNKRDASLMSMAKWFAGETGARVADDALQLHGGYGYMTESPIEHFFRDAVTAENYGGYKELEKRFVGREFLGGM
jgi:acyl-CoA dehydrogenase